MIQILNIIDNKNIINDEVKSNSWIHLTNPSKECLIDISKKTNLDYELLVTSIDEHETAHIDFENNTNLLVVDIPYIKDGNYVTIPFSILYNDNYFATICSEEFNIFDRLTKSRIETKKHVRLTIQILFVISNLYIQSLRKIDELIKECEINLINNMKNKELIKLMNINKSLVHFSTSLNSNSIVLSKLNRIEEFKKYEQDLSLIEDLVIEHNQATEMCGIYRDILKGSMESFSSIINNNMNNSMQTLAIITLALSFPTLIASIYGMNLNLPFTDSKYSFYIVIIVSFMMSILGGLTIYKITNKSNKKH